MTNTKAIQSTKLTTSIKSKLINVSTNFHESWLHPETREMVSEKTKTKAADQNMSCSEEYSQIIVTV